MKRLFLPALMFVLIAFGAQSLDLGDKALPITPEKWVTGSEADPTIVDDKTFFLVEVWSTTCPPCVRSIPIMNELQKKYENDGLKIVSFTTDTLEEVEPFLKEHPMEYSSFLDQEGATYINYMAANNRNTIPHAFLFDKSGILVWIGNPLDNLESRIKGVLDGTLNGEKAIQLRDAREELKTAFEGQDIPRMLESLKTLEQLEPDNVQYYPIHLRILSQFSQDPEEIQTLLANWYEGCQDNAEALIMLSMVALEQGHPEARDPALALRAAKRAFNMDSEFKLEAGLTLAEIYKGLGRIDLSIDMTDKLIDLADDPEERSIIGGIRDFFIKVQEVGKNPDAIN